MSRPRTKKLPEGIYARTHASGRVTYWISFRDADSVRRREAGGSTIAEATALLARRKREVDAGTFSPAGSPSTLSGYEAEWRKLRVDEGVRTAERERQIMKDHVLPYLGAKRLDELRPRQVADWIRKLRAEGNLSPKSIRNAHGTLSACLGRARFDELVGDNAAKGLPKGTLPPNTKQKQTAAWSRAECETLMSSDTIDEARRVLYGIAAFTGARLGECCGMRWRDLDVVAAPLWRWSLRTQWGGAPLKTDNPRDVPIHAELAKLLAAWKLDGWARLVRRAPTPDDFVVCDGDGAMLTKNAAGAKAVHRHAAKLEIPGLDTRDFHSFRRSFVTLARTDGAPVELVERITHNAKGEQIDGYTYFGWDALCSAVSCLRLARLEGRVAERRIPLAAGHATGHAGGIGGTIAAIYMEAPGVERVALHGTTRNTAENDGTAVAVVVPLRPQLPRGSVAIPGAVTHVTRDDEIAALRARLAELEGGAGR